MVEENPRLFGNGRITKTSSSLGELISRLCYVGAPASTLIVVRSGQKFNIRDEIRT